MIYKVIQIIFIFTMFFERFNGVNKIMAANLIIAFDEHGKQHTTKEIAQAMQNWQRNGDSVALLIGGADGLRYKKFYL